MNQGLLNTDPEFRPTADPATPDDKIVAPSLPEGSEASALHDAIVASTDRLFFISYTPPGVLRPSWHLVTVDLAASAEASPSPSGCYVVDFFVRPVADRYLSDISARWWPEWREFSWSADESTIELGSRVEIAPGSRVSSRKYVRFSLEVMLADPDVYLYGPFDFLPRQNSSSRVGEKIASVHWHALASSVHGRGVPAPLLTDAARENKRRKRGRNALRALVLDVLQQPAPRSVFAALALPRQYVFSSKGWRRCPSIAPP